MPSAVSPSQYADPWKMSGSRPIAMSGTSVRPRSQKGCGPVAAVESSVSTFAGLIALSSGPPTPPDSSMDFDQTDWMISETAMNANGMLGMIAAVKVLLGGRYFWMTSVTM